MRFFCFTLLLFIVCSCTNTNTTRNKLIHYVPEHTSIIIKAATIESLKSTLKNNHFTTTLETTKHYNNLSERLESLSLLKPTGTVLICFSKDETDSLQFTVITKYGKDILATDSLKNYTEETLTSKNKSIVKSTFNTSVFYSTVVDSTFIASSSKELVDLAHEKTNLNAELEWIYNTTSDSKTASIILKHDKTSITSFFTYSDLPFKTISNYSDLDANVKQNLSFISGITQTNDSIKSFILVFKNSNPLVKQTQNIVPYTNDGSLNYTCNNFRIVAINLNHFNK